MVRAVIRVPGYGEDSGPGPVSFAAGSSGRRGPMGMGKVPSLVFEMEDDDQASHCLNECLDEGDIAEVAQKLHTLLEPWSEAEYMLLFHVRLAREGAAQRGQTVDLPELADTLKRLGYVIKIRTALGGGGGGACLRNLRHQYLTCAVQSPSGDMMQYVVDPRFKEQFEIAHHTARYSRILATLGPEIVATADRLNQVVELLCSELARAFSDASTPLPPWRQHAAMLSKWQPRRSEEVDVSGALLNSELGLQALVDARWGGGKRKVVPLTGPATIAQRLAMLGVQQPSRVSPVAEGLEVGAATPSSSGGSPHGGQPGGSQAGTDDGRSSEESASLHLDTPGGEEEEGTGPGVSGLEGLGLGVTLAAKQRPGSQVPLPLAKTHSAVVVPLDGPSPPTPAGAASSKATSKNMHIWQGIKNAVAALPQRRNTWA